MAGHSKFKNIMHRKGAQDKKRSGLFSKLSREITVAAKMGTPDPDMNPRLRALLLLEPFDPLDEKPQLIRRDVAVTHLRPRFPGNDAELAKPG